MQDTADLRAFYMPTGAIWKHSAEDIRPAQRVGRHWDLTDRRWTFGGTLRLTVPGAAYSIIHLSNPDGSLYAWYVNLEEPLYPAGLGFDYQDNILDVVVQPDLSTWVWRDEDELEEAVTAGLVSKEKAASLYAEGGAAVAALQSGKSVFNGWENWRPDLSWPIPVLPAGWNKM